MTEVPVKQAPFLAGWLIAVAVAVAATAIAMVIFKFSFTQASFVGLILCVVVGVILGFDRSSGLVRGAGAGTDAKAAAMARWTGAPSAALAGHVQPEAAPAAAAAPVAAAAATVQRPAALTEARGGKADDLKQIKGVGPKMEQMCNRLGFYHFDQIAKWTADELAWVDDNLEGFKGRASRDEWVAQAKILAAGGETAFSRKVEKGGVY